MQIIKKEFIKKYYFDIVKTTNGFVVKNTHRKENMIDRDDIEKIVLICKTFEEAEEYLKKLKKGIYKI